MAWYNADGLVVRFGADYEGFTDGINVPRLISTDGPEKVMQIKYDLVALGANGKSYTTDRNNDGTLDGFNDGDAKLPAYASVTRVIVLPTVAAAGGTSIKLGTFQADGTAIDDDYLITATEGVLANLDTKGARTYGAGAGVSTSVETASVGSADAHVALTATGTFTAGEGLIYIYYIDAVQAYD